MEKITKREMYEALINLATTGNLEYDSAEGAVTVTGDALKAFAENEIALLDKKAVKAKERAATKRAEGDALTDAVRAAMSTEEFEPIADIAARIEGEDVTVSKITYRLGQLVKNGEAEKTQIEIVGDEGQKKRKVVAYKLLG